ncbi:hypothetical protein [Sorangium sp. So ce381]|uniref:hypothetical protein n=1 Tax=Sorangium sp. So ce381 TaxID=3133307 RepID=UPI003F5B3996
MPLAGRLRPLDVAPPRDAEAARGRPAARVAAASHDVLRYEGVVAAVRPRLGVVVAIGG